MWNNEAQARREIRQMVAAYYEEFKKPKQDFKE